MEVCQKFSTNTVSIVCRGSDDMLPSGIRAIARSDQANRLPTRLNTRCSPMLNRACK
jgi:hypothetical protein